MRLQLINVVVLAEDYAALRDWYRDVLELDLAHEHTEGYYYAELARAGRKVVGIAMAAEMGVTPGARVGATVLGQLDVADVRGLLAHVQQRGGAVLFGPSEDESHGFWYGGFADPEGNVWWVVESPADLA
jgi:predicted enzyme related to lactoylglutathione lyase